MVGQVECQD